MAHNESRERLDRIEVEIRENLSKIFDMYNETYVKLLSTLLLSDRSLTKYKLGMIAGTPNTSTGVKVKRLFADGCVREEGEPREHPTGKRTQEYAIAPQGMLVAMRDKGISLYTTSEWDEYRPSGKNKTDVFSRLFKELFIPSEVRVGDEDYRFSDSLMRTMIYLWSTCMLSREFRRHDLLTSLGGHSLHDFINVFGSMMKEVANEAGIDGVGFHEYLSHNFNLTASEIHELCGFLHFQLIEAWRRSWLDVTLYSSVYKGPLQLPGTFHCFSITHPFVHCLAIDVLDNDSYLEMANAILEDRAITLERIRKKEPGFIVQLDCVHRLMDNSCDRTGETCGYYINNNYRECERALIELLAFRNRLRDAGVNVPDG